MEESARLSDCLGEEVVKSGGIWLKYLRSSPSELESVCAQTPLLPARAPAAGWQGDGIPHRPTHSLTLLLSVSLHLGFSGNLCDNCLP